LDLFFPCGYYDEIADFGASGIYFCGDGVRVWKRDHLTVQEYRYVCRIGCSGVPMRVYSRTIGNGSWGSVEDYLPAGSALGYNWNWRYRHTGGELLMIGTTGEPSGYYPPLTFCCRLNKPNRE
jgi:hypothetical protein